MVLECQRQCEKSIRRIVNVTGIDEETVYAMLLMTASLMDLRPEDEKTADLVLQDIGIFPEGAA